MPRSRSMSIQSDVTPRRPPLPCTAPAAEITSACRASASVSVDLPASGWEMTANVRRRRASPATARPAAPAGFAAPSGPGGPPSPGPVCGETTVIRWSSPSASPSRPRLRG